MKKFTVLARVRKTITRYNMLPQGARVAVAVSGGADSICLLHALRELAPEYGIELSVAHFNHKLRGTESDEDERSVAQTAAKLGLPFYRAGADVAALGGNLEQSARRARRTFFAHLMSNQGIDRVALGHTRDDQAETVMFRFLRGAGVAGMAGIYPVTGDGYVRPLIDVARSDGEAFLRSRGITWREDSTNVDVRFARNRIRRDLLPQLAKEWNPAIRESLAHMADLAHEEERWWASQIEELAPRYLRCRDHGVEIEISSFASAPVALKRRLIRRAIALVKGDLRSLDYRHFEQVLDLLGGAAGSGRLRLPGAIGVRRSFDWLRIDHVPPKSLEAEPVPLTIPGEYPSADGAVIHFQTISGPSVETPRRLKNATLRAAELSLRLLPARLELRGWEPGDQYRPQGRARSQKIKEMFQTARIPSWRRQYWPIVSSGPRIVWARGFGAAADFAAGPEREPVLRIWEEDRVTEEAESN